MTWAHFMSRTIVIALAVFGSTAAEGPKRGEPREGGPWASGEEEAEDIIGVAPPSSVLTIFEGSPKKHCWWASSHRRPNHLQQHPSGSDALTSKRPQRYINQREVKCTGAVALITIKREEKKTKKKRYFLVIPSRCRKILARCYTYRHPMMIC
jgi:hypothetical protein